MASPRSGHADNVALEQEFLAAHDDATITRSTASRSEPVRYTGTVPGYDPVESFDLGNLLCVLQALATRQEPRDVSIVGAVPPASATS